MNIFNSDNVLSTWNLHASGASFLLSSLFFGDYFFPFSFFFFGLLYFLGFRGGGGVAKVLVVLDDNARPLSSSNPIN